MVKFLLDDVIKELKELHGNELDISKHHYFVFFQDGVFNIYLDQDDKTLKVETVFSDDIQVYHSTKNIEDLLKGDDWMATVIVKVKTQVIYFQTQQDELGITYATSDKRITIAEAEEILIDRQIQFKEILKVKYEFQELEIPVNEYEKYIQL